MKRAPILAEWKRAVESLGAAESCRRDGFYADCVSRTYYAILHGAKAALLIKGVGADSHAAVKRLFGLHFIQAGSIEPDWGTYLGESSDLRLAADYDVETPLVETDARDECDRARAFLVRIRQLLLENGLTSEELHAGTLDG